jgi:hypothetical protein
MQPAFASIEFGPFKSTYHSEAVGDDFKQSLSAFLENELLPQVNQPYDSTTGVLTADYDDQKYCGPRSAVRDIYRLKFSFCRNSGDDTIETELVFDPKERTSSARHRRPLFLWTVARKERKKREREAIEDVCKRIAKREQNTGSCPLCSASLQIIDSPDLFDVRCPERCFNYNFHRNPTTGAFLHGHFYTSDTVKEP